MLISTIASLKYSTKLDRKVAGDLAVIRVQARVKVEVEVRVVSQLKCKMVT